LRGAAFNGGGVLKLRGDPATVDADDLSMRSCVAPSPPKSFAPQFHPAAALSPVLLALSKLDASSSSRALKGAGCGI